MVCPVVFVPGVAGSLLYEGGDQLWPGCPFDTVHEHLAMAPGPNGEYISKYPVYAKDIIRSVDCTGAILRTLGLVPVVNVIVGAGLVTGAIDPTTSVYQPMVDYLTETRLLREYNHHGDPRRRTPAGCDIAQGSRTRPNFFVFPFDWRQDIAKSADELRDYVRCVERIHPGRRVDILAHSMGGLVARRYILGGDHNVAHLVTLGTPWLGAPKFPYVAFTGDFGVPEALITHNTIRNILTFFPGPHQLLPSPAYFDLIGTTQAPRYWLADWPLVEAGVDLNGNGRDNEVFDVFETFAAAVDRQFPLLSHPAINTAQFHDVPGQDDWRRDESGVSYLHVVGVQQALLTPVQVTAQGTTICEEASPLPSFISLRNCSPGPPKLTYVPGIGDGTVPLLSSSRLGGTFGRPINGTVILDRTTAMGDDLNAPSAFVHPVLGSENGDNNVAHAGLPNNPNILDIAMEFFATGAAPGSTPPSEPRAGQAFTVASAPSFRSELMFTPSFDLVVDGFSSVIITDENGLSFDAAVEAPPAGMIALAPFFIGPQALQVFGPANHRYDIRLTAAGRPSEVTIRHWLTSGISIVTRFLDVTIPQGTTLALTLGPDDAGTLWRDMDHDGVFETSMAPTVSVSGPPAQDLEPPTVEFRVTRKHDTILVDIFAEDSGTGVKALFYSLDGRTFFPYTGTLSLHPTHKTVIHAFAEDQVANRSRVFTLKLPASRKPRDDDRQRHPELRE
jgi:pimeloyl-ACP methyl ester carboxylesterase